MNIVFGKILWNIVSWSLILNCNHTQRNFKTRKRCNTNTVDLFTCLYLVTLVWPELSLGLGWFRQALRPPENCDSGLWRSWIKGQTGCGQVLLPTELAMASVVRKSLHFQRWLRGPLAAAQHVGQGHIGATTAGLVPVRNSSHFTYVSDDPDPSLGN